MIVPDTCIWIDFFRRKEPVFSTLDELLRQGQVLAAEWVFAELQQGARDARERGILAEFWENLPKFSVDGLAVKAGMESSRNRWHAKGIGLIDAMILTYARETSCQVWTIDSKLSALLAKSEKYSPQ